MKIKDITRYIETIAPPLYQESYDNASLIVGDPNWECTGALLTLDSLEATIDEALEKNCNLIIAHHPIVFRGLKQLNGRNYVERIVIKAIKNDVAIYAAHTNLDNVHTGVNKKICDKLGVKNPTILAPKQHLLKKLYTFCPTNKVEEVRNALFQTGAGTIGDYDQCSFNVAGTGTFRGNDDTDPYVGKKGELHQEQETKIEIIFPAHLERTLIGQLQQHHPYEEVAFDIVALDNIHTRIGSGMIGELEKPMEAMDFLTFLKETMQAKCVRHTNLIGRPIQKVAVCGGAGSFLLRNAMAQKADVFVTADYKYHEFFDADNQIIIADIGHYESEQYTIELFKEILTEKFRNFALFSTQINTNPINYL